ncbi:MAG TPA: DUF4382 domain-containing protein [Steroidobacteraceae bacterium]|nr:DUF4382 domain-containing protein [Steroidobacteraceae bacterium]
MLTRLCSVLAFGWLAILAACSGGSDGGQGEAMGRLTLRIGDAPVDGATEVVVVFTGVVLHGPGGTRRIEFPERRVIDLLAYQNGATADLLNGVEVEAGEYDWMRLEVIAEQNRNDGSYILFQSGEQYPLYVPSGSQTGLKLNRPFTVAAGGITRLVADFDLRKSIIQPPGLSPNYVLKPVLRLMDELEVGTIAGAVDLAGLAAAQLEPDAGPEDCAGGVYLFAGAAATPDDADGDGADGLDPVVYQPLPYDGLDPVVPYEIAFVEAGEYTVAATCNFDVDASPEASEYDPGAASGEPGFGTMTWTTDDQVLVEPNAIATVNLP